MASLKDYIRELIHATGDRCLPSGADVIVGSGEIAEDGDSIHYTFPTDGYLCIHLTELPEDPTQCVLYGDLYNYWGGLGSTCYTGDSGKNPRVWVAGYKGSLASFFAGKGSKYVYVFYHTKNITNAY